MMSVLHSVSPTHTSSLERKIVLSPPYGTVDACDDDCKNDDVLDDDDDGDVHLASVTHLPYLSPWFVAVFERYYYCYYYY